MTEHIGTTVAADAESEQVRSWRLAPAEFESLRDRVAAINVRAQRRGFAGRFELSGEWTTEQVRAGGDPAAPLQERVVVVTRLTGQPPSYAGWQFLAAVDTLPTTQGECEFVVRCAPGVDEAQVDRSRLAPWACHHCNTVRRNRRHTYLVQHEQTGALCQVGSSCLQDFLGWQTRPVFLTSRDVQDQLDVGGFGSGPDEFPPATVLAWAYAAVQVFGWRPASFEASTRDAVDDALYGRGERAREIRQVLVEQVIAGSQVAESIIDTLTERLTGEGGYEANLRAVLRAAAVGARELGLLCSAIPVWQRVTAPAAEPGQDTTPDAWIGTVGDKVTVTGTIRTAMTVDGYAYNATQRLLVIVTDQGLVKVTTAAGWAYTVDTSEQVTLTGTVKTHETYRDRKQTRLLRPKLVRAAAGDAEGG